MCCMKIWWFLVIGIIHLIDLTTGNQPKIVIIGAGASGIAAASKLLENGFQNIVILEAENRIGGRVHTVQFDGIWVDLGAQYVHGQTNNVVYETVSPLGLVEVPEDLDEEFRVYNSGGSRVPAPISNNLIDLFMEVYYNSPDNLEDVNGSIGDSMVKKLTLDIQRRSIANETMTNQFMRLFELLTMVSDGSNNWYEVSRQGYEEYWHCPGSDIVNWKDKGYGTILDILMKKYPNPEEELPILNKTQLNKEVVHINYNDTKGKAFLKVNDGQRFLVDHVIVTPSLGIMKEKYETLFTPPLPEFKVNAINNLPFGSVAKIYISFEEPWWTNDLTNFAFVWDEDDRKEYENDPNKKWLLDLVSFLKLPYRPRVLCGWLTGNSARFMETLPEEKVLNQTMTLLHRFLGNSYNITKPSGILRTTWYTNEHFRGTYSYRNLGSEKANVWADQLAAPVLVDDKPVIMFAGEATHAHYFSTVHGAIESGFREADRLINLYKNKLDQ